MNEHQALQHAERKVRTYRKAVLGLAGLLLLHLSLCSNLASNAPTILVFNDFFKESQSSADTAAAGGAIRLEGGRTRRYEPPYKSLKGGTLSKDTPSPLKDTLEYIKDTPDPSPLSRCPG